MQKPDLVVLNAKARESANDVSRIVYSNSYLIFILILIMCACFATYTLTVATSIARESEKQHAEHLMEMKTLHDKMQVMQIYMDKLTNKYGEKPDNNNPTKENLEDDSSSL